jgi:predicted transcriptional regulator|tara:strand:+ start:105 stop:575 length:471 start_codon:yes stop_codon:yes gene_type:complete
MSGIFGRAASPNKPTASKQNAARRITCGQVMKKPRVLSSAVTMDRVLTTMTSRDWDHLFLVDDYGVPVGRIHAVDMLKLIQRKRVNRDLAWMQAVEASQLISQPPMQVSSRTPLLKAAALMITHDINQMAVVDHEGALIGVISHAIVARHLPKFIL